MTLVLPSGLAYGKDGSLYFAETGRHRVLRIAADGSLLPVAGTGTQGFAGDGGAATDALLDSPLGLAFDAAGALYIADTHNHRVRRVDPGDGSIRTVAGGAGGAGSALLLPAALAFDPAGRLLIADAGTHRIVRLDPAAGDAPVAIAGSGVQGFAGDGGPALAAALDSPYGLACDAAGNVYLADTHNHRVRRIDSAGRIATVAGVGVAGSKGDGSAATAAALNLPRGLTVDGSGTLYLVDAGNHRIRRVDPGTGAIVRVAGDGTQAYAGDEGPAVAASLDSPRAVTLAPGGEVTLADTGNQRLRQIDANGIIHSVGGLGTTYGSTLVLSGPSVALYGTGTLTARLLSSAASGKVTFFDGGQALATAQLASNTAAFDLGTLPVATHRLSATYAGDATHGAAQSGVAVLNVTPAPALATAAPASVLYGQAIPTLTGSVAGILPRDQAEARLVLSSAARVLSPPGAYPIAGTLLGAAAGNYSLTVEPADVTIARAPAAVSLSATLAVHVATTTAGVPGGAVDLLEGSTAAATATLNATGDATFPASALSAGSHTLTAAYRGDANFLAASSAPVVLAASPADFALAATGRVAQSVPAGAAAVFTFTATPANGVLASPILLAASGLPPGATASFTPSLITPSGTATPFTLTIQTLKAAGPLPRLPYVLAMLLPLLALARGRRENGRRWQGMAASAILVWLGLGLSGCGDRVTRVSSPAGQSYTITVRGTATSATGAALVHSATVTLTVQ